MATGSGTGTPSQGNFPTFLTWIENEFSPRTLAISTDTLRQIYNNAVRYWNTHSAYKISQMVDWGAETRIQLSAEFKQVAQVYPNRTANWIWNDFPTWSLAGIAVMDNIRTDIILATEAFKTFNIYVGANFRWWFEDNQDNPTTGGYLYIRNAPTGSSAFFVVGTKRILSNEVIRSDHIIDWLFYYGKALVKQAEGHQLRAANLVLPNGIDGQQIYNEGREEAQDMRKRLAEEGRWVAFIRRQ